MLVGTSRRFGADECSDMPTGMRMGMMRLGRAIAAALLGLALASCGPKGPAPLSAFDGRLDDWTREILSDSPELAATAGVSEEAAGGPYAARIDDRSAVAVESRRSAALR